MDGEEAVYTGRTATELMRDEGVGPSRTWVCRRTEGLVRQVAVAIGALLLSPPVAQRASGPRLRQCVSAEVLRAPAAPRRSQRPPASIATEAPVIGSDIRARGAGSER